MKRALARLRRNERGFTLPEVLVAMVMMLTVMFALYSIFDMSLRVFSYGNDKVEAVENARGGLEKMGREVRSAYPQDDASSTLLTTWDTDSLSFGNDLNGDGEISCSGSGGEKISYEVYTTGNGTQALGRSECGGYNKPVAENVEDVNGDGQALTFEYFEDDGTTEVVQGGDEAEISIVRITLEVKKQSQQDAEQSLTTDVHLRNRSGGA